MLVFGPSFPQKMYRFHTLSRRIVNHKRRLIITEMREDKLFRVQNIIRRTLDQKQNPTIDEWHELQHKLLLNFNWSLNRSLIDRMILENCFPDKLDTGKSYMDYLKQSKQKLHQILWIDMLHMYYNASKCGFEITDHQQGHTIEMCQYLHGKHTLFSSSLAAAIILGFVLTPHWRKSLDILDSLRRSPPSMEAYIALVERAIQDKDEHLVWNIFERITANHLFLNNDLFALYLSHCETNATTFKENVDKMLTIIGTKRILVSVEAANEIQRVFRRLHYRCDITTVNERGECHLCGKRLRRNDVKLTDDEFNRLRNHFWNNISTKSTPNELESFRPYIDGTRTYDIVIDGLNMRTIHWRPTENDPKCGYELKLTQLANVVKYFADRKKKVLVIGRQYMNKWSKAQMDYIGEHADLFLTEDSSDDDQFFIYSALKSGPNTNIITRDTLQNHAHLFDEQLRTVFRRWQQQHQYSVKNVEDPDIVEFDDRIEFDMNAQQMDDGCWHIPFRSNSSFTFQDDNFFKLWKNWLCVSKE